MGIPGMPGMGCCIGCCMCVGCGCMGCWGCIMGIPICWGIPAGGCTAIPICGGIPGICWGICCMGCCIGICCCGCCIMGGWLPLRNAVSAANSAVAWSASGLLLKADFPSSPAAANPLHCIMMRNRCGGFIWVRMKL